MVFRSVCGVGPFAVFVLLGAIANPVSGQAQIYEESVGAVFAVGGGV